MSFLDIEGNSISPVGLASIQEALSDNLHVTQLVSSVSFFFFSSG